MSLCCLCGFPCSGDGDGFSLCILCIARFRFVRRALRKFVLLQRINESRGGV